ncbi:uncharacterized protein [Montipora capricornis]|uniref:uncharacterized protein n=1 Tax=Montipora capricornis TaxID=246305 RepID=UPI0035F171EC
MQKVEVLLNIQASVYLGNCKISIALLEYQVTETKRDLLALSVRIGGLGLVNPVNQSRQEYEASTKATGPLVKRISKQAVEPPNNEDVNGAQQCARQEKADSARRDLEYMTKSLPLKTQRAVEFIKKKGHFLYGHVLHTAVVSDEFQCHLKCLESSKCKSFNVHPAESGGSGRIFQLNNETRETKPTKRGPNPNNPAFSCTDILDAGDSEGDGYYWIDPGKSGNPLKAFCDMTTYGRGWLLISSIVSQTTSPPFKVPSNNSYRGIASGQMVLSKTAMAQLRAILPFTQLRFHCRKQKGRTFHVSTAANSSGEAVVKYFVGQTDVQPSACQSFVRMEDDNSKLAQLCNKWGREGPRYEVGKWGHNRIEDRLYYYPICTSHTYY